MDSEKKEETACSCGCSCGEAISDPVKTVESSCSCCGPLGRVANSEIRTTTSTITFANTWDHFKARWGVHRMNHRVEPGLYRLGNPSPESPVIVTANYTLSFDAVRSSLDGIDAYILVIDTKGVNVWCAAGKGTFGTGELLRRIAVTNLASVVSHRNIILPQLGASGVSAHEVQKYSGFHVKYGPVRSCDLPEFLKTGKATPEMRRVEFSLKDRITLTPIELVSVFFPTIIAAIVLYFLSGLPASLAAFAAVLAGTILFPILLPYIPTNDFSTKGFILGFIVAIPFAFTFYGNTGVPQFVRIMSALIPLLVMPVVTAYLALNFTGSTTFTSRTGVKKEIFRYIPVMVVLVAVGIILGIGLGIARLQGVF